MESGDREAAHPVTVHRLLSELISQVFCWQVTHLWWCGAAAAWRRSGVSRAGSNLRSGWVWARSRPASDRSPTESESAGWWWCEDLKHQDGFITWRLMSEHLHRTLNDETSLWSGTFVFLLPEELLAVVGRVRLLHLRVSVSGNFPSQRRREEGGTVPLRSRRRAEGRHLQRDNSCSDPLQDDVWRQNASSRSRAQTVSLWCHKSCRCFAVFGGLKTLKPVPEYRPMKSFNDVVGLTAAPTGRQRERWRTLFFGV